MISDMRPPGAGLSIVMLTVPHGSIKRQAALDIGFAERTQAWRLRSSPGENSLDLNEGMSNNLSNLT
jgi:hypothetical protein